MLYPKFLVYKVYTSIYLANLFVYLQAIGQRVFERRDQDKLVKTNAFLFEVLRYASVCKY